QDADQLDGTPAVPGDHAVQHVAALPEAAVVHLTVEARLAHVDERDPGGGGGGDLERHLERALRALAEVRAAHQVSPRFHGRECAGSPRPRLSDVRWIAGPASSARWIGPGPRAIVRAPMVAFPPFRLDAAEGKLWKGDRLLALRRKPFEILHYL